MKALSITKRIREFFTAATTYLAISVFFLFGLITSRGDAAQQDWGIPLTASAALNNVHSILFVWSYNGFGGVNHVWGFPFFTLLNASLAPFGFVGGAEIKLLSLFLVALAGITTYVLARSFGLGFFSSFLSGLFFMTTAVVFNWLMFGWIFYLIAYDLLPLMILATKKFLETSDVRYVLINAIILLFAFEQPAFILVYPLLGFLFVIFESRVNPKIMLKGLIFIVSSLALYLLTALSFFTSVNSAATFSFYQGSFYGVVEVQFRHLSSILNPIRLWGSTFNYQFETYFPKEIALLSFVPIILAMIGVLLRPRDRRVLFFLVCYLFAFVSYESYTNLHFLVYNLPYGSIFEAPSIFLVPASLGLALLIGYTNQTISRVSIRFKNAISRRLVHSACFIVILIIVISASIPWWTGQASGNPIPGPPTKLNLYQMPSGYTEWSNAVAADNEYFVLYVPPPIGNTQITNTSYFSQLYEGVSGGVFTQVNNLPYVSASNTTLFLNELINGSSEVGESWGSYSIKYIVVYTNVQSTYNMTDLLSRLSTQSGIVKVANLTDVIVYQNNFAKPIVYANSSSTSTKITYHDPTTYKVQATSTSPYFLVLNQVYAKGWTASVNGTKLTTHIEDSNGFNSWYINYTGNMTIDVYYEPQTTYIASMIISIIVIILISLYVILATIRNVRRNKKMVETSTNLT
jgi:hypothetical protein